MPLEDLVGNKFINSLNENWPLGSDLPDAGDDHLRGIKNVLKRSFPGVTGPVTLTQEQLNRGSVPSGSVMLFYQAAAPAGWTRVAGIAATHMLRVVESANPGGVSSGTDNPVLNDKVPVHSHPTPSIITTTGSANHTHGGATTVAGNHNHSMVEPGFPQNYPFGNNSNNVVVSRQAAATGYAGDHQHGIYADGANHTHTVPAGATLANALGANWTPRYMDVIVCRRD